MSKEFIIIFVTTANKQEGRDISSTLLNKKLIVCANMVDSVDSFFWWNKKIDSASEALLILKTTADKFDSIVQEVSKSHSYENPEIIAFPIVAGSSKYLRWIEDSIN